VYTISAYRMVSKGKPYSKRQSILPTKDLGAKNLRATARHCQVIEVKIEEDDGKSERG